jgi:predicted DNA-binding protein YlxM (UPF0122 family)
MTTAQQEITPRIDLALAIEYRYKNNLSYQAIADKFGVCKQAVQQRLASVIKLIGNAEENDAYERNRSQFLTGIERQLVKQLIDKKKIKSATLGNVAYAIDKVSNIRRLEQGLSTDNQAIKIEIVQFSSRPEVEGNRQEGPIGGDKE